MRGRSVASAIAAVLVALAWLAVLVEPAAAAPCVPPVPRFVTASAAEAGGLSGSIGAAGYSCLLDQDGAFRPSLTVAGVLAPGALGLPGEQITWIITVGNNGTAPGADIKITDRVYDELRIDSVEVDRGDFAISEQVVVFNTPTLQPGEHFQMRINTTVLRTPPSGSLANRAQLTAVGPDGVVEETALTEVFVPSGLPATGYPPADDLPGSGEPSVLAVALGAVALVALAAWFVWWRGRIRMHPG